MSSVVGLCGLGLFWGTRRLLALNRFERQLLKQHGKSASDDPECDVSSRVGVHSEPFLVYGCRSLSSSSVLCPSFARVDPSQTTPSHRLYPRIRRPNQSI